MDNENKEIQENESNLTPEERVKADISAKVSEAASELQDDINEVNGVSDTADEYGKSDAEHETGAEELPDSWDDSAWETDEVSEEVKPEPVRITLKRSSFITSVVAGVLVDALLMFGVYQFPKVNKVLPGGTKAETLIKESDGSKVVATVNGEDVTDLDVRYYAYAEAATYASENGISEDEMGSYDWDKEVDGKKLSDTILEKAVAAAIDEVLLIQKGAENGITLDEASANQVKSQVDMLEGQYGEDGLLLRVRTMGITAISQYTKMYKKVMTTQQVEEDMEANPGNYYPEDTTVLNDYIQDGKCSVKHILIKDSGEAPAEGEEAEDKQAKAQSILDRINAGKDFDALLKEFNEDTGEPDAGYTFTEGQMDSAFEEAAFALNIGEVSGVVKGTNGYHIIKRVPGKYELQAYWAADSNTKIKKKDSRIAKISVKDIMADVAAASEELKAESDSKSSSSSGK